ncbi:hypothetical protein [Streptomyces sp. NPDC003688]
MQSIGAALANRQNFYRRNEVKTTVTSIEEAPHLKETSEPDESHPKRREATQGEIPPVIDALIDNKMFRNKFKALIRRGHLQDLLELAAIAPTKEHPSRWFAKVTSKAAWERTLDFLKNLRNVQRVVHEVCERISVPAKKVGIVFKAAWIHRQGVIPMAVTAAETGKTHPFGLFCTIALKRENAPVKA